MLGTVRYQAPEVLRGGVGGSHSDVFSLGVTIWHLLTRSLPYEGLHPHIVIYQASAELWCVHSVMTLISNLQISGGSEKQFVIFPTPM